MSMLYFNEKKVKGENTKRLSRKTITQKFPACSFVEKMNIDKTKKKRNGENQGGNALHID